MCHCKDIWFCLLVFSLFSKQFTFGLTFCFKLTSVVFICVPAKCLEPEKSGFKENGLLTHSYRTATAALFNQYSFAVDHKHKTFPAYYILFPFWAFGNKLDGENFIAWFFFKGHGERKKNKRRNFPL